MATLFNPELNTLIMHVPRTGGKARGRALAEHGFHSAGGHLRLCDLKRLKGIDPAKIDKIICVIRHPAARELSQWMFSQNGHPLFGPVYDNVNDYVQDWKSTPLWFYERGWHRNRYREAEWNAGSMEEMERTGYYPYWLAIDGMIPSNVSVVNLWDQGMVFDELLDAHVDIPVMNDTAHGAWPDYFNDAGLDQLRRLYGWAIKYHYPDLGVV